MAKELLSREPERATAPAAEIEERDGVPIRPISEASLGRMMRQREGITNQVVGAVKEIQHLRMRQDALEKEKKDLETLAGRQEEYIAAKRDITDKLARSIRQMEKDAVQAQRMLELLGVLRDRFKVALEELRAVNEANWPETHFAAELNRAVAMVEDARGVYLKGLSKIEAESWHRVATGERPPEAAALTASVLSRERGFGHWVKVGLAVGLPFFVFLTLLFLGWVLLRPAA